MKQAATSTTPTELSPDFTDWLENEKADARSYQLRILKAVILIIFGASLFLLKNQPEWMAGLLELAVTPPVE